MSWLLTYHAIHACPDVCVLNTITLEKHVHCSVSGRFRINDTLLLMMIDDDDHDDDDDDDGDDDYE